MFTQADTPAQIVNVFPKASDLFKIERIDFCCGGDVPLQKTFNDKAIDGEAILKQLNQDYTDWQASGHEAKDWSTVPLSEIIDHIVYQHHAYLQENLSPIGEFVNKILRVHGMHHPELKDLHRLYHAFKLEMEQHSIKEEQEVFPLIKKYESQPNEALLEKIRTANGGLEDEHDEAGNLLKAMRDVTNDFEPPVDACGTYRLTFSRLAELEEETFQHVHLENNILFKRL